MFGWMHIPSLAAIPINMTSTVGSMWCKVYIKFENKKLKKNLKLITAPFWKKTVKFSKFLTQNTQKIENSFKLIKHHVWMNAHTKFGSDPPRNLREKLHQR